MAYSFNKLWAAMAVSLATSASIASANSGPYSGQWTDADSCGPRPTCGPCGSWYFDAEALFWKAHEDGLGFAERTVSLQDQLATSGSATRIQNPRSRWDTGYRLGVGYDFNCDCWDVSAYWTHFQTEAKKSSCGDSTNNNEFLVPLFSGIDIINRADGLSEINARWRLRLDYADFVLGREFCISPCVTLRPFLGVRSAWINQKYRIRSASVQPAIDSVVLTNLDNTHLRTDFDGTGLLAGLDSQWNVGCGVSVYGSASASLLYGRLHSHGTETAFFPDLIPVDNFTRRNTLNDKRDVCKFSADAALGLRWKRCFCDDTVLLTIDLGWEQHLFFDQNRFEIVPNQSSVIEGNDPPASPQIQLSDLCVQGITLGARLDF